MEEEEEEELKIPFALPGVHFVRELGKGAQGRVILVRSDQYGLGALKYSRIGSKAKYENHDLVIEAQCGPALGDHPHIIKVLASGNVVKGIYRYLYVLLELHQGDLEKWNQTRMHPKSQLQQFKWTKEGHDVLNHEETMLKLMALQISSALDHMQRRGYIHRDIKPLNMGLAWDEKEPYKPRLILCDFGFTRKITDEKGQLVRPQDRGFEPSTTYAYASPDTLRDKPQYYLDDAYNLLFSLIRDHFVDSKHALVCYHEYMNDYPAQAKQKDAFMKDPVKYMSKLKRGEKLADLPPWLVHMIQAIKTENPVELVDYKELNKLIDPPEIRPVALDIPSSPAAADVVDDDDLFALSPPSSTPKKLPRNGSVVLY